MKRFQCYFAQKSFIGGDIANIESRSRSMSLRDLRSTLDLQSLHGPELDNNISKL